MFLVWSLEFCEMNAQEDDVTKRVMTISVEVIGEGGNLKYLGYFVQKKGCFIMDVKHRNKCGRIKYKLASGFLSYKKIQLKGKFDMIVERMTIIHGSGC